MREVCVLVDMLYWRMIDELEPHCNIEGMMRWALSNPHTAALPNSPDNALTPHLITSSLLLSPIALIALILRTLLKGLVHNKWIAVEREGLTSEL